MKKLIPGALLMGAAIFSVTNSFSQITAYPDTTVCSGETLTLYSDAADFCGDCYTYEEIPYAPETIGGDDITMVDDTYEGPFDIGFEFCFFGTVYTEFYVCSNGWISFEEPGGGWAGNWTPDGPVPDDADNVPKAAIFGPWTDWHTGLCTGCVSYELTGTAPDRRMIVTWEDVPLFSCTSDEGTFQIVLHETTNFIDNHLTEVLVCPAWDLGISTQGLQNQDGTIAYTVEGRNATEWDATDESYRWYTSFISWFDEDGELIGNGPTVDVTPETTTTYTVVQTLCDGTEFSDEVTVTVGEDFSGTLDITDVSCGGLTDGQVTITLDGAGPYEYDWSTGETGSNSIDGLAAGTYSVTVTAPDGCEKTFDFEIIELEPLTLAFEDIENAQCFGFENGSATIAVEGGATPYTITSNGEETGSFLTELGAGSYDVIVTDANGCTIEDVLVITEPDELSIVGSGDVSITYGLSTELTATPSSLTGITGVTWAPEGGVLGCDDDPCFIYTVTPVVSTTYYVSISDENGCFAIDTINVTVIYTNEVLVPNAFSPNGDNVNDQFQGIAFNLSSYYMGIYNRWGELVYETNSIDYVNGWDGSYNGKEAEVGTYVYYIDATFQTGVDFQTQGSFQLIR